MLRFFGLIGVVVLTFGATACGSSSGGAVNTDAALRGFMQAIALDFAQVLADVAPSVNALAVKQDGSASCPQGGSATWTASGLGGGTLNLTACRMRGIDVTGTLGGFLDSSPDSVSATMLSGPVTASGGFSADLNVTDLIVSAQLPIADATTFWQVTATTTEGSMLCAWSGGSGCGPSQF